MPPGARLFISKYWRPLVVFLILFIHGALLGLSDDEAYYWVLAQTPSLGYAFHPPAVAWFIAFFQALFGWIVGHHSSGLVRLPAALGVALILSMSLKWLEAQGLKNVHKTRALTVLLSFFGFFALAWMMVPDIPLLLGWTLLFTSTWIVCFGKPRSLHFWSLGVGSTLLLLSKYSGVLAIFSSYLSLLLWASSERKWRGFKFLTVGGVAAILPILYWNSLHEWGSILYQIRDRHGGGQISWMRYARFWAVEAVLAGPLLVGYTFVLFAKAFQGKKNPEQRLFRFFAAWVMPAALVFCIQPLFSDFKPHWAFVVWWPVAIALAWASRGSSWKWIRYQAIYGLTLGCFILLACHLPLGGWAIRYFSPASVDPRLDVTNDLYGWPKLSTFLNHQLGPEHSNLPVVGSRYQTAAQSAFSLGDKKVTLLPKDLKEMDEWPNLNVSDHQGPGWPKLITPILFISDIRYDAPPSFPGASCKKLGRLEESRFDFLVKWIDVWRCDP